ncbi:MAG: hypothetical protein QM622_07505 [Microbacterium sp.]
MTIQTTAPVPPATAQQAGFTAYEYASVRAPRDFESLYRDTYRAFGWTVESTEPADPIRVLTPGIPPTTITLKLKRDRNIRNRSVVHDLQRKADASLSAIVRLERSKTARAFAVAATIGIVGAAFLAGSVFLMNGGLIALSIVLGAVGLVGWVGGFLAYQGVAARRSAAVTPLIDREFDVLYETTEQAAHLHR